MKKDKSDIVVVPAAFWREHKHLDTVSMMLLIARTFGPFVKAYKKADHYLVADADVVHHILVSDRDAYKKAEFPFKRFGRLMGEGLLTNLSDTWFERRKLLQKLFTADYLKGYAAQTIDKTNAFLEYWDACAKNKTPVNLYDDMMMLVMTVVSKHFLGDDLAPEKARELVQATHTAQRGVRYPFVLSALFPTPTYLRFRYSVWKIDRYVSECIDAHSDVNNRPDDMLSFLLEHNMPWDVVRDEGKTAILSGHETTGAGLTWCFHLLMEHPEIFQKMQAEVRNVLGEREITADDLERLPYVRAVWEETLRLYPPVWAFPRVAVRADTLMGYRVPRDAGFVIMPSVIQRLEKYWDQPDDFIPERFLGENKKKIYKHAYIPFATGPHVCLGKQLATRQAMLILAMITQRFSLERLSKNTQPLPRELYITMFPKEPVVAKVVRRV